MSQVFYSFILTIHRQLNDISVCMTEDFVKALHPALLYCPTEWIEKRNRDFHRWNENCDSDLM